jgi:alpha-glucosidase (family GH31 glycosyl hydrolase)
MEISVLASMKMNMFGIPLVGADICGFGGDSTTAQLCTRWH